MQLKNDKTVENEKKSRRRKSKGTAGSPTSLESEEAY